MTLPELQEGMKVKALDIDGDIAYTGTIFEMHKTHATIERDDRDVGAGAFIDRYGDGWLIDIVDETWTDGEYEIVPLNGKITNWKEVIEQ